MVQFFELLKSKTPVKIIRFFLEYPTNDFYEREIQIKTELSKGSVNRWIRELEEAGIIESKTKGRLRIFKLNNSSPVVKQLKILYIIDKIYHKVKKFNDCRVFLYGSAARGEYDEKSDIDILVIGQNRNIAQKIRKIDAKINVSFYTPIEWSRAGREDPAFFQRVEKEKIRLV